MKPPALAQKVVAAASAYPRPLGVSPGELRHVALRKADRPSSTAGLDSYRMRIVATKR